MAQHSKSSGAGEDNPESCEGCLGVCEQPGCAMAGKALLFISAGSHSARRLPGAGPSGIQVLERENKAHEAAEEPGQLQRDGWMDASCCVLLFVILLPLPCAPRHCSHFTDTELLVARRNHKQQNHFQPCHSLEVFITFICTLPPFPSTGLKK